VAIPEATIDNIRDRTDIVEVVAQYVDLKRAGTNHKGLCPFHQERTPSFNVNAERQIFHCFGCGKGGNVFSFLMEIEGVSFPEAVRQLGSQVGIEVEERSISDEERSRNDRYYQANAFAARFYHSQLMDRSVGRGARTYLEGRAIPQKAWRHFGLGYAPDGWDRLWTAARHARVGRDVLTELKLIVARKESTGYYDYFRNRVMFPIIRPGGRVVGFGARAMGDGEPKYLNSAESPVFAKRRIFYGVDRARDAIRKQRHALVVEGYTDLISLHLAGMENTVAVCGTAMTPDHAQALRRMTQRAILVPDGDDAGERAAVAAGAIMLAAGLEVAVVRLEKGMDPDTAAREAGPKKIAQMVAGAIDYFQLLDYIVRERELTARDREDLTRRVAGGLVQLGDGVRRDVLIGDLARALEVAPESLQAMSRSASRRPATPEAETPSPPPESTRHDPKRLERERLALRLIMEGTPRALEALDALDADDFCEGTHRKIYNLLDSARGSHIDLRSPDVQRRAEETGLDGVAAEIALISVPPGNVETLLDDTVRRIKQQKIDDELAVLREQLKDLPPESGEAVSLAEHWRLLQLARDQL